MAQKHYQSQFKGVLGVGAWPGTLNVDVGDTSMDEFRQLRVIAGLDEGDVTESAMPIRIEGFERDGRSFGGATAFRARICIDGRDWVACAILIPDLTRHTSTAEVISGAFLRESIPCSDRDLVCIELN
jgi:CTP-dependent riboflavin kinase